MLKKYPVIHLPLACLEVYQGGICKRQQTCLGCGSGKAAQHSTFMHEGAKKEVVLPLDQEAKETKKSALNGLSEFETANSRLYPKIFSLIIAKNFKAKAHGKQLVPGKSRFSITHFTYKHTLTFLFLKRL